MIAPLLLVAIFSSALYFEAEARFPPKKCDPDLIRHIYTYWHTKGGGVPQHMIYRNVRYHPREVAVMSTQEFFDTDVTCAVMYHDVASHTIYYMNGDNLTATHEAVTFDWSGQTIEPLRQNIRLEIAEAGGARLLHLCSRRNDAEVGSAQFLIKGAEGKISKEGLKTMQELLVNEFNVTETLRTFSTTCRLPQEKEQTHGHTV